MTRFHAIGLAIVLALCFVLSAVVDLVLEEPFLSLVFAVIIHALCGRGAPMFYTNDALWELETRSAVAGFFRRLVVPALLVAGWVSAFGLIVVRDDARAGQLVLIGMYLLDRVGAWVIRGKVDRPAAPLRVEVQVGRPASGDGA